MKRDADAFMMLLGLAAAVVVCVTATAHAAGTWEELGPVPIVSGAFTGRISAVVCDPVDADRYFAAGADGGVWRTLDGGVTWEPLTDDMPTTAMGALAMDPSNPDVVYAGTGEANYANHSRYGLGLFKTTDGGDTWQHLAEATFAGRTFSKLVINPLQTDELYAAIAPAGGFPARAGARGHPQADGPFGVFKSIDGGVSWTHLTNGLPMLDATDLAIDPSNPQVVYAGIGDIFGSAQNGVYKSTNGGASWTKLGGGLPSSGVGRVALAVAPSDPEVVYVNFVNVSDANGGGASTKNVYRSDDAGASWTPLNPGNFQASYGWYLAVVGVHPTEASTVLVGGLSLLRSLNAGGNWSSVTPPHVDMHAITWDAAGRLVVGDDGGVHRSENLGQSWSSLDADLGCIQFYAGLSLSPASADFLYGGTQDNGTNYRTEADAGWTQVFGGDGGMTGVRSNAPQFVFCEFQGTGNLQRSNNFGFNPTYSGSGISGSDRNCFLPPYVINPVTNDLMMYGTNRVWVSNNGGNTWGLQHGDLTNGTGAIRCLALAPSRPPTVYAVTNDGNVQVTTNFGATWNLVRTDVPGWPRTTRQVVVDPEDDRRAVLVVSYFGTDHVLLTENLGASWSVIDGDLPDIPVNTVAIEKRPVRDIVYLGADDGVYRSLDEGLTWHRFAEGLPRVPVVDLIFDVDRSRLVAGTQGRGAWQIVVSYDADFDADNDVDLLDFLAFQQCMGGPDQSPALAGPVEQEDCLAVFDADDDGDVDLEDFGDFQQRFTGAIFPDCNQNGEPDACDLDCAATGEQCTPGLCGLAADCNSNALVDACEPDCNANDSPDDCDIAAGTSIDCNANDLPDECEVDCNVNGVADVCEIEALIVAQPVDVLGCPGEPASFFVDAPTADSFQWRRDGVPLADGSGVSGATTANLHIASIAAGDYGSYTCVVALGCLADTSDPAELIDVVPPSVTQQPNPSPTLCMGSTALISLTAGGTAPLYAWAKDDMPLANGGNVSGVDTATLRLTDIDFDDAADYTCTVSDVCGNATVSNTSALTVASPQFQLQPVSTCVELGATAVFNTQVTTALPLIGYSWRKDGAILANDSRVSGADTDTLTISNVEASDEGSYQLVAFSLPSPICVTNSDTAALTVGGCR